MFQAIATFFMHFFTNFKADPVNTAKGAVQIAAGGATAYGMSTGAVPVNELSIGTATALITSGIHAMGTNTKACETTPEALKAEAAVTEVGATAAKVLDTAAQVKAIEDAASDLRNQIQAYQTVANAVSPLMPPEKPKPENQP